MRGERRARNALLVRQFAIQSLGFNDSYEPLLTARNYHYAQTFAILVRTTQAMLMNILDLGNDPGLRKEMQGSEGGAPGIDGKSARIHSTRKKEQHAKP